MIIKKNKLNTIKQLFKNKLVKKKIWFSEILKIQKITKIEKKGKIIRFKIFVVTGNKKNKIGLGIGKDITFNGAFQKAVKNSYNNIFEIHKKIDPKLKYKELCLKKTKVIFKALNTNFGIKANSFIYVIFSLAGITDISAKVIGSKNKVNYMYLTFKFLNYLRNKK